MSAIAIKGMIDSVEARQPVLVQFDSDGAHILVDQDGRSGFLLAHGEGIFVLSPLSTIHWVMFRPAEEDSKGGRILRVALVTEEYLYELVNPQSGQRVPRMYFVEDDNGWAIANDDLGL